MENPVILGWIDLGQPTKEKKEAVTYCFFCNSVLNGRAIIYKVDGKLMCSDECCINFSIIVG